MSKAIDWYFDFISPFAYLQQTQFPKFPDEIIINPKPVLFAGLLNHWGHKGPAEIPTKRVFTFQHASWLSDRLEIPFRMPPAHPFNPLRALRLAIALENDLTSIRSIFDYIWRDGLSIEDDVSWFEFTSKLGINNAEELTGRTEIKQQLRQNTEEAIQTGVFGVPSIMADGHLFWGFDATDMYLDYQQNPKLFDESETKFINEIPESASRTNR